MSGIKLLPPAPLNDGHDLGAFDSGVQQLDDWLKQKALRNEVEGGSRSFVACAGLEVIGYYSLAAGSVHRAVATGAVRRNMPDPVPVLLLGRLAVDQRWQGRGFGASLLRDAVLRMSEAAQIIGARAIMVHAISDGAKIFYERHGFRASLIEPMTLMITISEARSI